MNRESMLKRTARQAERAEKNWKWNKAADLYERCSTMEPNSPIWATNLANCLWLAGEAHDPRALETCLKACRLAPEHPKPWIGLGHLYRDLERYGDAELAYAEAMRVCKASDQPEIAWCRSQNLIGLGEYSKAYTLAEQRLELDRLMPYRSGPYWEGWHSDQKTTQLPKRITVWTEQGFGDTIQYSRWLIPLLQQGVNVTLEAESALVRLLEEGLRWTGGKLTVVSKKQSLQPDLVGGLCHGSLLSLPTRLGGAPFTQVDQPKRGYLRLNERRSQPFDDSEAQAECQRSPRIGLVWASGNKNSDAVVAREYQRRSLPSAAVQQLIQILDQEGSDLVCLQYGCDQDRAGIAQRLFSNQLPDSADFLTTAEWIDKLDLIISVDTAYAHLAGALHKPVWVLLPAGPDPRWAKSAIKEIRYSSATLIRQDQPNNWEDVIMKVARKYRLWKNEIRR